MWTRRLRHSITLHNIMSLLQGGKVADHWINCLIGGLPSHRAAKCQIWYDSFVCQCQKLFIQVLVITQPYHKPDISNVCDTVTNDHTYAAYLCHKKQFYYCASYCYDQRWWYIALPSLFFHHMMIWYFPITHTNIYLTIFAFFLVWFSLYRGITIDGIVIKTI